MTRSEKAKLRAWATSLTNEELEQEYYDASLKSLGSEAERMYEMGYDIADCIECEKNERDLVVKADILGSICEERGIQLYC